jgi:hypothetical protein
MISTPGQTQIETANASAPTLHSSSQVSGALGKGILPMISGHMAAGLSLYHLDAEHTPENAPAARTSRPWAAFNISLVEPPGTTLGVVR